MSGEKASGHPGDPDLRAHEVVARAHELARQHLAGIEEAAAELVEVAGGDGRAVTAALRLARLRAETEPTRENKQAAAIIRRAIEVGMHRWGFEESRPL